MTTEITVVRVVDEPCQKCEANGGYIYSSTALWRRGIGGQAFSYGVCDNCWGSGDQAKPWDNLREMEAIRRSEVQARAMAYFAERAGCQLQALESSVELLIAKLEKMRAPLKGQGAFWFRRTCDTLAAALKDGLEATRARRDGGGVR